MHKLGHEPAYSLCFPGDRRKDEYHCKNCPDCPERDNSFAFSLAAEPGRGWMLGAVDARESVATTNSQIASELVVGE